MMGEGGGLLRAKTKMFIWKMQDLFRKDSTSSSIARGGKNIIVRANQRIKDCCSKHAGHFGGIGIRSILREAWKA